MSAQAPTSALAQTRWDFAPFGYALTADEAPTCPRHAADLNTYAQQAAAFQAAYKGKLNTLLPRALQSLESLRALETRIYSYASLMNAQNQSNEAIHTWYGSIRERLTEIDAANLTFFDLEIAHMEDADYARLLTYPLVDRFSPFLDHIRMARPYMLSEAEEQAEALAFEQGPGRRIRAWDKTLAESTFTVAGNTMGEEEALSLMMSPNRDTRRAAFIALSEGFTAQGIDKLSAEVGSEAWGFRQKSEAKRGYKHVMQSRNMDYNVTDEVAEALHQAGLTTGAALCKRAYKLKAKLLNLDKLEWYDRNAPLPFADHSEISWEQAKDIVLQSFGAFSPTWEDIARQAFENGWIDAPVYPGKRSGAFCMTSDTSTHPYVMMNFQGKAHDVLTLAHELGHCVHEYLSIQTQGQVLGDTTPLTLAEMASTFGEMLVFQNLLARTQNPQDRLVLIMDKINDGLNTVCRQLSFSTFEQKVHGALKAGQTLTTEDYNAFWMDATKAMYGEEGDVFTYAPQMNNMWCYVSHFMHVPFYVYSYAYADLIVHGLYAAYQRQKQGFAGEFIRALSAAGTKKDVDLLAPFNLNPASPTFWVESLQNGLGTLLDEAEKLTEEIS